VIRRSEGHAVAESHGSEGGKTSMCIVQRCHRARMTVERRSGKSSSFGGETRARHVAEHAERLVVLCEDVASLNIGEGADSCEIALVQHRGNLCHHSQLLVLVRHVAEAERRERALHLLGESDRRRRRKRLGFHVLGRLVAESLAHSGDFALVSRGRVFPKGSARPVSNRRRALVGAFAHQRGLRSRYRSVGVHQRM
jgi:hypothetical protein